MGIAACTGVRLHLAHFRTPPELAGSVDALMAPIDQAIQGGLDCSFDVYPYPTGSSILISRLPSGSQDGGAPDILRRLGDAAERQAIVDYLDTTHGDALGSVVLTYVQGYEEYEGRSLSMLAAERGVTPGSLLADLLLATELAVGYLMAPPTDLQLWSQLDADCMTLLSRDDYMVCSDATPAGRFSHPRTFGAFPRFLGRLRRHFSDMSMEAMIERMTSRPASRFGLRDRGVIREGAWADLVVFDPDGFIDLATYEDPRREARGVLHLIVNGVPVVRAGAVTGELSGRAVP
jgi:N-acyl-D-amino-acid deacylase